MVPVEPRRRNCRNQDVHCHSQSPSSIGVGSIPVSGIHARETAGYWMKNGDPEIAARRKFGRNPMARLRWVYLLPLLHLCACFGSMIGLALPKLQYLGVVWVFIMLADLPVSSVAYMMGWKYPTLAALWIVAAGTLWWYLLGLGIKRLLELSRSRQRSLSIGP